MTALTRNNSQDYGLDWSPAAEPWHRHDEWSSFPADRETPATFHRFASRPATLTAHFAAAVSRGPESGFHELLDHLDPCWSSPRRTRLIRGSPSIENRTSAFRNRADHLAGKKQPGRVAERAKNRGTLSDEQVQEARRDCTCTS